MLRARFCVNIKEVNKDYRPIKWPIKYPYWCSGENDEDFILIAFVENLDELYELWPEAKNIEYDECDEVYETGRFKYPDWYVNQLNGIVYTPKVNKDNMKKKLKFDITGTVEITVNSNNFNKDTILKEYLNNCEEVLELELDRNIKFKNIKCIKQYE